MSLLLLFLFFVSQKRQRNSLVPPLLSFQVFLTVSLLLSVVAYSGLSDKLGSKNSGGSGPAAKKRDNPLLSDEVYMCIYFIWLRANL